jgi:hypothetical protein
MIADTPTSMVTRTAIDTRAAHARAEQILAAERLRAPATKANTVRNARAEIDSYARWAPARDALWQLLDTHMHHDTRVALVGAGNADDLPLTQIAGRAREVTLVDLDGRATRRARRQQPRRLRRRINVIEDDITHGVADRIAIAAAHAQVPPAATITEAPLPGAPYDLVIGDLLYSQLLYPALVDLDLPAARTAWFIDRYAPMLTRSIIGRFHVSAPDGQVLHIHDPLAWWPGHHQSITLNRILTTAEYDLEAALTLAARGTGPHHSDPRTALDAFAIPIRATALWRWPFSPSVDYLACATLTDGG